LTQQTENDEETTFQSTGIVVNQATSIDSIDIGIISELASIGAGHAATSLSDIFQQPVLIDVPKIHNVPAHLLPKVLGKHDESTTAIYIQLASGSECDILFMLESNEARKIAAQMTMVPSVEELDPAMEASAVEELANIVVGSFLSAISDFIEAHLVSMPPQRIVDTFDAILDNFLLKNAMLYNESLLFDVSFRTAGSKSSNCTLLLFPCPDLQHLLVEKSKRIVDVSGV
jgi:chemotaxis protein CheC